MSRLTLLLIAWIVLSGCHTGQFSSTQVTESPTIPPHRLSPTPIGQPSQAPRGQMPTHASSAVAPPTPNPSPTRGDTLEPIDQISFSAWELVLALAWSPDGNTLAIAAGENIHLVQMDTLREQLRLPSSSWPTSLVFNPTGSPLAAGQRDGQITLWRPQSGELLQAIPAHKKGVNSVAISPDGNWLASGGNDAVARVWEISSGKQLNQLIGGTYAVPALAFFPEGEQLAIANGNVIRIRQTESGRFVTTLRNDAPIYCLAVSPNGRLLALGDMAGVVRLWEVGEEDLSAGLPGTPIAGKHPASFIWSLAFSPDSRWLAAAGGDGMIRLWSITALLKGEVEESLAASRVAHDRAATSLAFSPDGGLLASGGLDGIVRLWRIGEP